MALNFDEYQAFRRPIRSPEQLANDMIRYRRTAQMSGLSQASSGDYRNGLGVTSVPRGQADLEPGDYGYQYASTTKPGTTVVGRRQGFVKPDRRIEITRMVEQLEFLAGTPGVHPRALAQKVWAARRALMGAGDWSWASYADPRDRYDAKKDLEDRLAVVERVLGVGDMSPRLMMAYGSGAMSGLGSGTWNRNYTSHVNKLASCIQGALCVPKAFCCSSGAAFTPPPGGVPQPPARTWVPEEPARTWVPEEPDQTWIPGGDPKDQTWIPGGDPGGIISIPGGDGTPISIPSGPISIPGGGGGPISIPGGGGGIPINLQPQAPKTTVNVPGSYEALVASLPQASPAPAITTAPQYQHTPAAGTDPCAKDPNSWECHASKTDLAAIRARAGGGRPTALQAAAATAGSLAGLGQTNMPNLRALQAKLRQARGQIARRRV